MLSTPHPALDIKGQILTPEDTEYEEARKVFSGAVDRRPALIVRVADADDVARVIALARDTETELAVRGGGHSPAGHGASEGGIVLDLSALRALEIDPERRTAWAGTGLTAGEYTTAAHEHGLATGFGDAGTVGLGGITLAGGIGFLVRKHGMTIDDLLAAEIVTADGELLRVDADHYSDLFWAIRGGGGNFGVATRLKFRLHEVGTIVGGMLFLPATPEVITAFVAEAEAAPDELTTIANVMPAPPLPVPRARAPRLARPHGHDRLRGRRGGGRARRRAVPGARDPARRHGPPDGLPRDVSPARRQLPARRGRPHLLHRQRRAAGRRDDRRAHRELDGARGDHPAARPRRRDGARPGGRDRVRPPQAAHHGHGRLDVREPRGAGASTRPGPAISRAS